MLEQFRPVSTMIALWPTQEFEFGNDWQAMSQAIRERFDIFDQTQFVQAPNGQQLPPELPRLILRGDSQQWILEISPAKIVFHRLARQSRPLGEVFNELKSQLTTLVAWLAEKYNFHAYRIGSLTRWVCLTRSSANAKIADYFLTARALQGQGPHEIQMNVLAKVNIGSEMTNRWFRIRPMRSHDGRQVDFSSHIEVDINTLPEMTQKRRSVEIEQFLTDVELHINQMPFFSDPSFNA